MEELDKLLNPQVVKLIRSYVTRGEGAQRRSVAIYHEVDGTYAGEYDPAVCRTCLRFSGEVRTFCTSSHK